MSNPTTTVRQLRVLLAALSPVYDDHAVAVWLPGSRIDLNSSGLTGPGDNREFLIEGNLRPGSALEQS